MNEANVGKALCAVVDPILEPLGFLAGQGARGPAQGESVGLTFCAAHDAFSDRFPWLPQAEEYPRGEGSCIDLVIEVDAQGIVNRLDLESYTVEETLRAIELDEPAASARLVGRDVEEAIAVLPGLLRRLFKVQSS